MQSGLTAVIFFVLHLSAGVLGDDDIKRGTFRFMAFVYYQDETVVDGTGARFLQGGVLIRPNFLISSSLVSSVIEDPLSKTLLARLGAIRIDANFTLNEDEDEQEQEVIQIIQPHQHNRTHWWATDISLLKTLEPFLKTSTVHVTQLSTGRDYGDKICNIVVFKKKSASAVAEGLFLTQLPVEMLPVSRENCGEQFDENTMTCATDPQALSDEKAPLADFCQGNSGGPLICDNDVMALQTYIDGNCDPPHLYQLLAPWRNFLSCGTEDKCDNNEKCLNVCSVTYKDEPITVITTASTSTATVATTTQVVVVSTSENKNITNTTDTTSSPLIDDLAVTTTMTEEPPTPTTVNATTSTVTTTTSTVSTTTATVTTSTAKVTHTESMSATVNDTESEPWPRERETIKHVEVVEEHKLEPVRGHKIEAQRTMLTVHSVANKSAYVIHGLFYSVLVMWICLV